MSENNEYAWLDEIESEKLKTRIKNEFAERDSIIEVLEHALDGWRNQYKELERMLEIAEKQNGGFLAE